MTEANLTEANLTSVNLRRATLRRARLYGTTLTDANLQNVVDADVSETKGDAPSLAANP